MAEESGQGGAASSAAAVGGSAGHPRRRVRQFEGIDEGAAEEGSFAWVPPSQLFQVFLPKEDKLYSLRHENPYVYLEDQDVVDGDFPVLPDSPLPSPKDERIIAKEQGKKKTRWVYFHYAYVLKPKFGSACGYRSHTPGSFLPRRRPPAGPWTGRAWRTLRKARATARKPLPMGSRKAQRRRGRGESYDNFNN